MEGKDIKGDNHQDLLVNFGDSPSQVRKETADFLRRETDSMDDFEHLEHDNQHPLDIKSEKPKQYTENDKLINIGFVTRVESDTDRINTAKEPAEIAQKSLDEFMLTSETDKDYDKNINLFDLSHESSMKPLVVDNLGDLGQVPPIPPHAESMKTTVDKGFGDFQQKPSIPIFESQNFMDMERHTPSFSPAKTPDLADRFSDSEPEIDDFKPSSNVLSYQKTEPKSEESSKPEMFKDVIDQPEPLPERDYFESPSDYVPKFEAESVFERKSEPVFVPEPVKEVPKPILEQPKVVIDEPKPVINEPELLLHETVREDPKPEPVKRAAEPPKVIKCQLERSQPKKEAMGAELMFCKMGLGE